MSNLESEGAGLSTELEDGTSSLSHPQRSTALSNKISNVLSTSFVDAEIREALRTLDERKVQNTPEGRRRLRIDVQKEVIDCDGDIVKDFGQVAKVCTFLRALSNC